VIAYCKGPESSDSDLGYGADIGGRFTPDDNFARHVFEFLFFIGQRAADQRRADTRACARGRPTVAAA
jgi:hypothetical protein